MAGAYIEITAEDLGVLEALNRLQGQVGDLTSVFNDIGEYLLISERARFDAQEAPDGTPWAPLSPKYQRRKAKNKDRILVLDGYLRDLMRYQSSPEALEFGTDRIYGAAHQFGRPEINLPARPFLGLSDADEREVLEIIKDQLDRAAGPP